MRRRLSLFMLYSAWAVSLLYTRGQAVSDTRARVFIEAILYYEDPLAARAPGDTKSAAPCVYENYPCCDK